MQIFGPQMTILERSLDLRMENQRLITANVANMDTPGFTAQRMDFKASMENAIRGASDPAVIENLPAQATTLDGNNVDLDQEMAQLSQNKFLYSVQSQILGMKFRQMTTMLDAER